MDNIEISLDGEIVYLEGDATKDATISNKGQKLFEIISILDLLKKSELDFLNKKLVIDLSGIMKIDTIGLAVFMQWMRELNKLDINVDFIHINEKVNYACRLYGVSNIFA